MRRISSLFFAVALLMTLNCGTDSPTSPRIFTDSLSLGTGYRGLDLTVETYTFTITHSQSQDFFPTIYWRAESKAKMKGAIVELDIVRLAEIGPEPVSSFRYEMSKLDDYVVISSYLHIYGAGKFRATATMGELNQVLGIREFTVK